MTTLVLLRLRFKLIVHGRKERLLLVEEAGALAFSGILAFKESGWEAGGDLDVYSTPGISIGSKDGIEMQEAGYRLWRLIDQNPTLAQSVGLDINLFFLLTQFVGKGPFSVRESGACD